MTRSVTDEWRKLFTRTSPNLSRLRFSARAMADSLIKYADAEGRVAVVGDDEDPAEAVAFTVGAHPEEFDRAKADVAALLKAKHLAVVGGAVEIVGFVADQTRMSKEALKKAKQRERQRREQAERDGALRGDSAGTVRGQSPDIPAVRPSVRPSVSSDRPTDRPDGGAAGAARTPPLELVVDQVKPRKAAAARTAKTSKPETPPLPFTLAQLERALAESSRGRYTVGAAVDGIAIANVSAIKSLPASVTLDDVRRLGAWYAAGGAAWVRELDARYTARTGMLAGDLAHAKAWDGVSPVIANGNGKAKPPHAGVVAAARGTANAKTVIS